MSQSWDLFLDDGDNEANDGNANTTTDNSYLNKPEDNSLSTNPKLENDNNKNVNNTFLGQQQFTQHENYTNSLEIPHIDDNTGYTLSSIGDDNSNYNDDSTMSFATPPPSRPYLSQQHYTDRFGSNMLPSSLSTSGNYGSFQPQSNHLSHRIGTMPRFQTPPPQPISQISPSFISSTMVPSFNNGNMTEPIDNNNNNPNPNAGEYYFVQFHPNRTLLVKNTPKILLDLNDYVRGYDIGKIVKNELHPLEKDVIAARNIIRKATPYEVSMIPNKEEKEKNARNVCQEKADELGLPMKITATELQFDGKKLTVYFSANQYIDFRNLVHTLFREFGTRIWMVWFDGTSPVRDVFTHSARERRFTME